MFARPGGHGRPLGATTGWSPDERRDSQHDCPRRTSDVTARNRLAVRLGGHRGARRDPPDHGRDRFDAFARNGLGDVVEVDQM